MSFGGRGKMTSRSKGVPLTDAEKIRVRELRATGMKYQRIAFEMNCSLGTIGGVFYRDRHEGAPVRGRPAHTLAMKVCLVSGCEVNVEAGEKFCEHHTFKPRTDFPASKLQGRRA